VIGSSRQVPVFAFSTPVDMRKSFDALASLVTEKMEHDVLGGAMFLFVSRDRKKARVLFFDGTGLCLYAKRLARGAFAAPWMQGAQTTLTISELALFLEGSALAGAIPLSPPALQRAPAVTASSFAR
jgi:transposase